MNVNLKGYLLACRYALPHMIAGCGGSVINMSSGSGLRGDNVRIAYGTSKGAIATMTQYIATQHGKQGVRCNAIAPGMMADKALRDAARSEEHTSELQSLMRISYAVFCLKKKTLKKQRIRDIEQKK